MDRAKKVVFDFLNSAEGYFHMYAVVEKMFKQPRDLYGPMSDRPEKWDYTDIRDLTREDFKNIIDESLKSLDKELYKKVESVALNAALQNTIHSYELGKFQSKIDARTYNYLLKILELKASDKPKSKKK